MLWERRERRQLSGTVPDARSKGREFESRKKQRGNFLLPGEFSFSGSTYCADPYFGIRSSEPVRPNGKALAWKAEGLRFESVSALLSLQIIKH